MHKPKPEFSDDLKIVERMFLHMKIPLRVLDEVGIPEYQMFYRKVWKTTTRYMISSPKKSALYMNFKMLM